MEVEIIKELPFNSNWVMRDNITSIILHHAKAVRCTIHDIDRWHYGNGWNGGCGYHFFVRKNGKTYEGRPIWAMGAHCAGYNNDSIGICLEGDFEIEEMDHVQENAVIELLKHLISEYPQVKIFPHHALTATLCPGTNFPLTSILSEVYKQEVDKNYKNCVDLVSAKYELESPEYWYNHKDKYVRLLFQKIANKIYMETGV